MINGARSRTDLLVNANEPGIDRCMNTGIQGQFFSAAACTASVGERVFHRSTLGSAVRPPPSSRIDASTVFDLASLTKPLASGLAALWLSSRGRLDIRAPIARILPELRHQPAFETVTVDMLLDHTSGFPATVPYWRECIDQEPGLISKPETVSREKRRAHFLELVLKTPLEQAPGTKVIYSDIGFIVLGWIVEKVTGQGLDVWLEKNIFRPLGLQDDLFFVSLSEPVARPGRDRRQFVATERCPWRHRLVCGEVHDPNAWVLGGVAGHAGLFGTADAVWSLAYMLHRCWKGEDDFFPSSAVRRFWTRSKRVADSTRTLAWDTPTPNGSMSGHRFSSSSVGHLGFTGTSLWIDAASGLIGVLLTNSAHPSPDEKREFMKTFRPRVYDLIAKSGEALLG